MAPAAAEAMSSEWDGSRMIEATVVVPVGQELRKTESNLLTGIGCREFDETHAPHSTSTFTLPRPLTMQTFISGLEGD